MRKKILFIAGFPPPASGQLIMQKKMYDVFATEEKRLVNLNFTNSSKDFSRTSIKKIFKMLIAVGAITMEGLFRNRSIDKVYYSLSGPKKNALMKDILIGIPLTIFFKKKLVLQVHAGGYNASFVESEKLFARVKKLYGKVNQLLCLTEYQRRELEFLQPVSTTILYNFSEDRFIDTGAIRQIADRKELRLLSVGHLNPNKGIAECIKLAVRLKERGQTFTWRLVGAFQDPAFEKQIRDAIKEHNLDKEVNIINEMANSEIYKEYAWADYLIFLSNGPEGQPVVLIECLMMSRAVVIVKNISGIDEYIINGHNGFLVNDYTEVLPLLLDKEKDLTMIRENARKTYLQDFSDEVFSKRIRKIFNR